MLQLITSIQMFLATRRNDQRGATMVEYGLIVALIAIVVAVAATTLGTNITDLFNTTAAGVKAHAVS